jgi:polyhydroxyalkanoate synthesis repressor PhaR
MTETEKHPITIKKYANRRLYNTGTSSYVTLEDLAAMVKNGEDFQVFDAKTGDEITRTVLTQIIFEQESKNGQSLLPTAFLRQLIRFYGDSMQMLVPSYLEFTIDRLTNDQHKMREQLETSLGAKMIPGQAFRSQLFDQIEEQTRKNLLLFSQALTLFNPFAPQAAAMASAPAREAEPQEPKTDDLAALRSELSEIQKRLDRLVPKDEG